MTPLDTLFQLKSHRLRAGALAVSLLACSGSAQANPPDEGNPEPGFREVAAEYMADYFSDPRRTGSLAGGIIGGALTAHPVGPVIGGIVGFIIGKRSLFSEEEARRASRRYSRELAHRPIVPADVGASGGGALSLSEGTLEQPLAAAAEASAVVMPPALGPALTAAERTHTPASAPMTAPGQPGSISTDVALAVSVDVLAFQSVPVMAPVPRKPLVSNEQLASLCAQGALPDPRLRAMCYYSQSY